MKMTKVFTMLGALALTLTIIAGAGAAGRHLFSGADIRDGSIASRDIANRTIQTQDMSLKALQALRGQKGAKGDTGADGATGATGPSGGFPSSVPSGTTVRGVAGIQAENPVVNGTFGQNETLAVPATAGLSDADVAVNTTGYLAQGGSTAPTTSDTNPNCTGTPSNPTAPAGKVCIYVLHSNNATNINGSGFGSANGFKLSWTAPVVGNTYVDAIWAYTAP